MKQYRCYRCNKLFMRKKKYKCYGKTICKKCFKPTKHKTKYCMTPQRKLKQLGLNIYKNKK